VIRFVLDASALVELTAGPAPAADLSRRAMTENGAAPEVIDVEALQALRGLLRLGAVGEAEATRIAGRLAAAPIVRMPHRTLLGRIWSLRGSVSAYDASYVALAETLGVPLLTCDARLGRAHGHGAEVLVYPRS
jgi:predicted nucleic acid-binding protein